MVYVRQTKQGGRAARAESSQVYSPGRNSEVHTSFASTPGVLTERTVDFFWEAKGAGVETGTACPDAGRSE